MSSKISKASILVVILVFGVVSVFGVYLISQNSRKNKLYYETEELIGKKIDISGLEEYRSSLKIDESKYSKTHLIYILSSCEACKKEIEIIEKINKAGDLNIIGVMTEEKSKIEDFVEDHKVNFPIFVDKDAAIFKSAKLKYFPTNLVVENGIIKKALLGMPEQPENFVEFITED